MKTIKQIADDIGVTKQAIFKRIKTPPLSTTLEPFMSKVNSAVVVSEKGEKLIKQAFSKTKASTTAERLTQKELMIKLEVGLQFAERENEFLRSQVANLQEQNEKLTAALITATDRKPWRFRLPWGKKGVE
jgi:predicted transcriptional regulator